MDAGKRSVTVIVPFPSSKLSAHNKGHWRSKATPVRQYRFQAKMATLEATGGIDQPTEPIENAAVVYRFFVPDNRRRDEANMVQMVKPAIDGVVDAGLIVDDCWQHLTIAGVEVAIDRDRPRVELIFSRTA